MQASFISNFLFAAVTALLTGIALFAIWDGDSSDSSEQAIGEMLAETAARASIDGLIEQDAFEVGVVANRLAGVPRVAGVAIYTLENELLAISGTLSDGTQHTHPVVLDDMLLGFARVSLAQPGTAPDWTRVGLSALALLAVPLISAFWSYRMRNRRTPAPARPGTDTRRVFEATTHHLLVGNLHNQFGLNRAEREQVAARALAVARQVDEIYNSGSEHLPGTGLLLAFPSGAEDDRAFEAVCAGFLLAKCLRESAAPGDYRFGLHTLQLDPGESLADHRATVEDTALLAAVGRSGAIIASESFFDALTDPGRLDAELFSHPMLKDLGTSGDQCHLITGLGEAHEMVVVSQAGRLFARNAVAG